jgi:hypothetical protein
VRGDDDLEPLEASKKMLPVADLALTCASVSDFDSIKVLRHKLLNSLLVYRVLLFYSEDGTFQPPSSKTEMEFSKTNWGAEPTECDRSAWLYSLTRSINRLKAEKWLQILEQAETIRLSQRRSDKKTKRSEHAGDEEDDAKDLGDSDIELAGSD